MLSVGVNRYRKHKKKKETPWTFYAEELAKKSKKKNGALSLLRQKSARQSEKPGVGVRRKVRHYVFSEEPVEIEVGYAQKELKQNLALAFTSLSLISTGVTPFSFVGLGLLVYLNGVYFVKDARRYVFKEKRIGAVLIDTINFYGSVLTAHFFAAAMGTSLYYSNRTILWHTEDHSTKSLINVFGEQPRSIWVLSEDVEVEIPFEQLKKGDLVVVHAGESIAVDGTVQSGIATIDQRALTGESQPIDAGVGEEVLASTLVISVRIGKIILKNKL